ncbi:unnamed protein product [Discosporangium mesarthrocarpum]
MTRVGGYDQIKGRGGGGGPGGGGEGSLSVLQEAFKSAEAMLQDDVNEGNMNPLRDTARVLALESLGHEVRCVSKVSIGNDAIRSGPRTRGRGGGRGEGRLLETDMSNTGASRGFVKKIEEKWGQGASFDAVFLDHYWLPDSVIWLKKGYMANDGGLIENLIHMKTDTRMLRNQFEIMLPINQAFFQLLLPHFKNLETHFNIEFLVGDSAESLKAEHLALRSDELISEETMQRVYGKNSDHQVRVMLGVKQPTTEVAATLVRHGVGEADFCKAKFVRLTEKTHPTQGRDLPDHSQ